MDTFKTAVILAGGKSSRMGFDKQLLTMNKSRLIEKMVKKLGEEFEDILVVTNHPEYYTHNTGIRLIGDEYKGMGPLGGIHVGLKNAASENVYFIACDMPYVNLDYIRFMKEKIEKNRTQACVTKKGEWIEPLNAFYSKSLIKKIEADLDEEKASIFYLLKKSDCLFIGEKDARYYSPDWNMFMNLNTREDLDAYMNLLEG